MVHPKIAKLLEDFEENGVSETIENLTLHELSLIAMESRDPIINALLADLQAAKRFNDNLGKLATKYDS